MVYRIFPFLVWACFIAHSTPELNADSVMNEDSFEARAEQLLRNRAQEDPMRATEWASSVWPIGQGDPHKYILPDIVARLHFDPTDKAAWDAYRYLIEVDKAKERGDRGMYHFAVPGKARIFFQHAEHVPDDVREWIRTNEGQHLGIFRAGGTENHQTQSRISGYLFTEYFQTEPAYWTEDHKQFLRDWTYQEAKKLYRLGMGEWDSSTYVTFTVGSWLNLHDLAADENMRNLARAAVDWYATAYGLKYFHGIQAGPENRGFARTPAHANSDIMAWLWWGNLPPNYKGDVFGRVNSNRYAVLPAVSDYRPHPIINRIARKEVPLPFEVRASKPSYFGYSRDNIQHEYLYHADGFTMGTLYCPTPGDIVTGRVWPQTTMFKLAVKTEEDVLVMGAANGYHRHFPVEGRTPYDQYHQSRGTMLNIAWIPDEDTGGRTAHRSFLAVPVKMEESHRENGWFFFHAGNTHVAVFPLGQNTEWSDLTDWTRRTSDRDEPQVYEDYRWLETHGRLAGWVIDTGTVEDYPTVDDFRSIVLSKDRLDLSAFRSDRKVTYHSLYGETLGLRHTGGPGGRPDAWIDGEKLLFENWPVYESPYVNQDLRSGILRVNDGETEMVIDFSGEWPERRFRSLD